MTLRRFIVNCLVFTLLSSALFPYLPTFASSYGGMSIVDGVGGTNKASVSAGGAVKVDNSAVTQPVSGSLSVSNLPAVQAVSQNGTWTLKLVDAGGVNLASISAAGALKVDSSAVTQPVSGTFWQATQPVSIAATVAVDASGHTVPISGTLAATQSGTWNVGTVSTVTSITNPVAVTGTFWQATQPVTFSGTVIVDPSGVTSPVSLVSVPTHAVTQSGTWNVGTLATITNPVAVTGSFYQATQPVSGIFWQATQPVSGTVTATVSGGTVKLLDSGGVNEGAISASGALSVDGSAVIQPVSGTFWQATQPVSGTFWQATQPVSGTFFQPTQPVSIAATVSVDPSGVTSPVSLASVPTHAVTQSGTWNIGTVATITNPVAVTGSFWQATQPVSGTFFQATQPVSGTVAATQSGTWNVGTVATITNPVAVTGTFWQATQPVSGTVAATQSGTWNTGSVATLTSLDLAQGSTTSGQTGPLIQTATTVAAPTYVTAKTNPLSTTTAGALRVDNSAVTQPVSGTVAATQSGTWTVQPGNTANTTAWKVDGSAVTQPVSLTSVPTHAVTQSGTWNIGTLTTISNSVGVTGTFWQATQPVSGTFWQATQPVSGTVAATQSGTWNTGTVTALTSLDLAQGSTTSGQTGPLIQTATTVAAPTYVTAKTNPLSTTTAGALRVDNSAVTQPVSGTIAATQSGTWTVQPGNTANTTAWKVDGSAVTQPVSGTFWQATQPVSGTFWQATQPVSGTVAATQSGTWNVGTLTTITNPVAVTGTFWQATQPVSGTVAATQSGTWNTGTVTALTSLDLAQGSTTSGQTGPLIQTATTVAAPTYVTAKTNPLSTTTAGALRVDNSAVTQPVSGTVAATQSGTWTVQPGNTANTTAWKVDGSAVTQPVSGTFWPTTAAAPSAARISVDGTNFNDATHGAYTNLLQSNAVVSATNTLPVRVSADGTNPVDATHGVYFNQLQGNAVLSATNGAFHNNLQGNVALSATNGIFTNVLNGNAVLAATNPLFTRLSVDGTNAMDATHGGYTNILQGNAVISATNTLPIRMSADGTNPVDATHGVYFNQLQGNAVLSATNGTFQNALQGNAVLSATNGSFANVLQGNVAVSTGASMFVQQNESRATYYCDTGTYTTAASPTDIFTLQGSGTKTIRIVAIYAITAATLPSIIRRTTADSGGTSASLTVSKFDTGDATAAATLLKYTANPAGLGTTDITAVNQQAAASATTPLWTVLTYMKPIYIRGTTQYLVLNGGPSAGSVRFVIIWTEE